MPLFFFDIDDGQRQIRDETGMMLADVDAVIPEVKRITFDLAFAELLRGVPRQFKVLVRDEGGTIVYQGSMTLQIDRPS